MVDVAPTLAALLGTNLPATSQGSPLVEMMSLTPERADAVQAALSSQQSRLLEAYSTAIGQKANLQPSSDSVVSTQAAMSQMLNARLNQERWPRFVLAALIAILPAALWLRRGKTGWPRTRLWLLGGAMLYVFLFNFRYAVLSHRTYSLSSVGSATELILYCAGTVAISLIITWLVIAFSQRVFLKRSSVATELVLDLALTILYILMLPVLFSFALNGVLVTWALPDFASLFLGFISLIQVLLVAILGPLLCGVTAGIVALSRRRA